MPHSATVRRAISPMAARSSSASSCSGRCASASSRALRATTPRLPRSRRAAAPWPCRPPQRGQRLAEFVVRSRALRGQRLALGRCPWAATCCSRFQALEDGPSRRRPPGTAHQPRRGQQAQRQPSAGTHRREARPSRRPRSGSSPSMSRLRRRPAPQATPAAAAARRTAAAPAACRAGSGGAPATARAPRARRRPAARITGGGCIREEGVVRHGEFGPRAPSSHSGGAACARRYRIEPAGT